MWNLFNLKLIRNLAAIQSEKSFQNFSTITQSQNKRNKFSGDLE